MSPLYQFVTEYLADLSPVYYLRQYIVILVLFVFGALLTDVFVRDKKISWVKRSVLAYPLGISAFAVTAYAVLVLRIPYNTLSVSLILAAECAAAIFIIVKRGAGNGILSYRKHMLTAAMAAAALAALATSGLFPVSISNDTMYYFKRYPDAIVYYRGLRDQFDFFLTDTGLGVVSIDTLPALFGFGETFGIREFFHMNFLLFFAAGAFERAKVRLSERSAYVFAVILTGVLAVSTPFVILGHWALANMYFMEMFFIAAYTALDHGGDAFAAAAVMITALGLFRIEGTVFVIWLVLCVSSYSNIGRKAAGYVILPMGILFSVYCLNVFIRFNVLDNMYLFLSPVKAVLIICMMAAAGIYLAFVRERLPEKIRLRLPLIYIAALAAGNAALFVYDSAHYTGNLAAFRDNLFRQSGWGMFPYFVIAAGVFLIAEYSVMYFGNGKRGQAPSGFGITMVAGFLLIVLAASFGRGDLLAEDVGDSGNRVLLQVTPLIVMTFGELFLGLMEKDDEKCQTQ